MNKTPLRAPVFEPIIVEDNLKDGYWIQAVDVDGDGTIDLVASGLAVGEVVWYHNPSWRKRIIAQFPKPVALDAGDVAGAGFNDLVVCHDYGNCMFNCGPDDGKISWLRNPGSGSRDTAWETRHVGNLVATHRLRLGDFTHSGNLDILALPVVGPQGGRGAVHSPARLTLFRRPQDVFCAKPWADEIVNESDFRVVHDVLVSRFTSSDAPSSESVLLATEEGVSWFGFCAGGDWRHITLGQGEVTQFETTGFRGSGNVSFGRIGEDAYAYLPAIEPFHGNTLAIYTKEKSDLLTIRWKRQILDVFGDPNEHGEGAGHHVVAADFDGDGDDEFLVALRGPMPWQGVFYYKAIDLDEGLWTKTRISSSSAARIAVADFDQDGRLDFATTGYYTPGYFLADHPQVLVFYNRFGEARRDLVCPSLPWVPAPGRARQ
jgi:hypothetical protein